MYMLTDFEDERADGFQEGDGKAGIFLVRGDMVKGSIISYTYYCDEEQEAAMKSFRQLIATVPERTVNRFRNRNGS